MFRNSVKIFPPRFPWLFVLFLLAFQLSPEHANAQNVATWTGGGDGVSYSDPDNWSNGVVPINEGGMTYNVIVPDGQNIIFDAAGSISGLSYGSGGSITVQNGVEFAVNSVATLNSSIFADGSGTGFEANGIGVVFANSVRTSATNGAVVSVSATSYNYDRNTTSTVFHADGVGSQIIADSLTTISHTAGNFGANYSANYIAENGGMIDFSNVQSLDGGTIGSGSHINQFMIRSNGNIDFQNLSSITQRNQFDIDIPFYELPSLETADGLTVDLAVGTTFDTGNLLTVSGGQSSNFIIPESSVWNAPNLETLDDTNLTIGVGGALNASNLQRFRNSSITLQPGVGFNVGSLIDVDNSRFKVEGGSVLGIDATSYGYNRNTTSTLFHADGVGSQIIADSLTTISHTAGNFGDKLQRKLHCRKWGDDRLLQRSVVGRRNNR